MLPNDTLAAQHKAVDDKIQRCMRSDDGKVLIEKLLELHHMSSTQLKTAREVVDIYRYQGRIEAFELILKMREEK